MGFTQPMQGQRVAFFSRVAASPVFSGRRPGLTWARDRAETTFILQYGTVYRCIILYNDVYGITVVSQQYKYNI